MITIKTRLEELESLHGSLNNTSINLGIDPGYWSRLKSGEKTNPGDETLSKIGLVKIISYKLITTKQRREKVMNGNINNALIALDRALLEIENGFVACVRCGDQEETKTLDFVDDIKLARESLIAETYKSK